jgi:hypothetical protein
LDTSTKVPKPLFKIQLREYTTLGNVPREQF